MKARLLVLALPFLLALSALAQERRLPPTAERRVALVVGNDSYPAIPLRNGRNDAREMAATLTRLGFEVDTLLDADSVALERHVRSFVGKLASGDVGFFFYAGHGVQIEGENYLVPVDFDAQDEPEAKKRAYPLDLLRTKMDSSGARLKILVLDACRDNPFRFTRSGSRGLGMVEPGRGTLIAFATGPGRTASDNAVAGNGLFTQQLLRHLTEPGLKVQEVFERARVAVDAASGGSQTPWVNSNVIGDFYLASAAAPPSAPVELAFWNSIKDSTSVRDYEAYLAQFPSGTFAPLAHNRIEDLRARQKPTDEPCSDARSCFLLANKYDLGDGVAKDLARATALYKKACDLGHPEGCHAAATSLFMGQGPVRDPAAAAAYSSKGCDKGVMLCCYMLGVLYKEGDGVAQDSSRAAALFRKACQGGENLACEELKN